MKRMLHLIASPRGEQSTTLRVSKEVIRKFLEKYPNGKVDSLDLFVEQLPSMTIKETDGKYLLLNGKELDERTRPAWEPIIEQINRFKAADIILISVPMWNFGMPYVLKHYFDVIIQPGYLFRYTASGPEGLAGNKLVIVISSRGGDYSAEPAKALDHLEPSLKTMLSFIGIQNPLFINIQPVIAGGPKIAQMCVENAIEKVRNITL